ncbi:MAG: hypothetical protein GXN99_01060 [Candidatus Nanohaloarchaeota archaeon]|nr:hypothetical protein [Candidatus Nanohaloarchaeota archaeon]
MELKNVLSRITIWKGVGKDIEHSLANAKQRIYVITPWISKENADLLAKKSKELGEENVMAILVEDESNYYALKDIASKRISKYEFLITLFFTVFSFFVSLYTFKLFFESYSYVMLAVAFILLIASFLFYVSMRESFVVSFPFNLVVQRKKGRNYFLHAKLYIIDNHAYITSANLTHAGLWKNIESLVSIEDKNAVEELIKFVHSIERKIEKVDVSEFMRRYALKNRFLALGR